MHSKDLSHLNGSLDKGMEHVICDVITPHCINIVAVAILQYVSN